MAEVAILVQTVAIYAYLASCFPTAQGEVSALVNFARTMGGFAVPYFQVSPVFCFAGRFCSFVLTGGWAFRFRWRKRAARTHPSRWRPASPLACS